MRVPEVLTRHDKVNGHVISGNRDLPASLVGENGTDAICCVSQEPFHDKDY